MCDMLCNSKSTKGWRPDRWDAKGPMAPLHAMNPLRARFVRDAVCRCFQCATLVSRC